MKTRIIQTRYWDDGFVVETAKFTKYLYIYILTSQYINISGIFQLHDKKIMMETDLTPMELSNAKDDLMKNNKVLFKDGWVYVVNAERNNGYKNSPDNVTAYEKEISLVPQDILSYFKGTLNRESGGVDSTVNTTVDSNQKQEIRNNKSEIRNKKDKVSPKYSNLHDISNEDLADIAERVGVAIRDVKKKYEEMLDAVEANPNKYKYDNYKAALRRWVRRGVDDGKIKVSISRSPDEVDPLVRDLIRGQNQ